MSRRPPQHPHFPSEFFKTAHPGSDPVPGKATIDPPRKAEALVHRVKEPEQLPAPPPKRPQGHPGFRGGDRLLSVKEVALRYAVGVSTVWRWDQHDSGFPSNLAISSGATRWTLSSLVDFEEDLGVGIDHLPVRGACGVRVLVEADNDERFLDVHAVAEMVGVSAPTIWRWVKNLEGFPKPIRISTGTTRWRQSDLAAFVQERIAAANRAQLL